MDKETLDIFVSHLRPIRVPRKTILIKPLVKDNNVYMIERGIARSFNLINGKEMTSWFSQEGELIYSHIEISNWLRLLHQKAFVEMERRLIYRLYMSAEERYKDLYQKDAGIFQRVNLSYIASYLGISPVTLWKLRKDIK